ncbi:hypothetical protein GCM10011514_36850 [Emticicia aquatilis]|uniref:Uncharacterized protein n=1 Tax=Emticicia aquatilis TaxID=1537369 RepID=A0A916Z056_9BACT|nr:hypothetical protein GCM10011514_36850 [Emticicia aquatilis]
MIFIIGIWQNKAVNLYPFMRIVSFWNIVFLRLTLKLNKNLLIGNKKNNRRTEVLFNASEIRL